MSDNWLNDIKVGNYVIISGGGFSQYDWVSKVDRLTKTQIIVSNSATRFRRNSGSSIGNNGYYSNYLREADDDSIKKITEANERRKYVDFLDRFNFKNKSLETLRVIYKIVLDADGGKDED